MIEADALRVLDLGVGKGGNYLRPERRGNTQIVGVDLFYKGLQDAQTDYRIPVVRADAFHLPFADGSFNKIQLYFPHDSVLYGLSRADSGLWKELGRVLVPSGEVSVIFDVYPTGKRIIGSKKGKIVIDNPQDKIATAAKDSQFSVSIDTVDTRFLFRDIGTNFSTLSAQRSRQNNRHTNYHLQAVKK